MREARRVEIQAEFIDFGPRDPVFEMIRRDGVAINFATAKLAVKGMQIHPMGPGNKREGMLQIGAKFVRRRGFAGIIARDGDAAAEPPARVFKPADIVALPALE